MQAHMRMRMLMDDDGERFLLHQLSELFVWSFFFFQLDLKWKFAFEVWTFWSGIIFVAVEMKSCNCVVSNAQKNTAKLLIWNTVEEVPEMSKHRRILFQMLIVDFDREINGVQPWSEYQTGFVIRRIEINPFADDFNLLFIIRQIFCFFVSINFNFM